VTTQTEINQRNHHRAVRYWPLSMASLSPSAPEHPARVYCCAVGTVAAIGVGAFAVSFLALRDLMQSIGYSSTTACVLPAIIDTAVAVSTLMLVALGAKPTRSARTRTTSTDTDTPTRPSLGRRRGSSTKSEFKGSAPSDTWAPGSAPVRLRPGHGGGDSAQAEAAQADATLASELIASGTTTQPVETVIAVLQAHRDGASINAAAKASAINYRTAQRIIQAAEGRRHAHLVSAG
jgi:Protein of unknown function (DUF2637)